MGIAAGDYSGDGRPDLFVSNSRGQRHAVYRSGERGVRRRPLRVRAAFGTNGTGWGVSWVDFDLDGRPRPRARERRHPGEEPDAKDAGPSQMLEHARGGRFADVGRSSAPPTLPRVNGRGLAAADFDNDGHVDLAVNSVGGQLMLLRARGGSGHWLEVRLPRFAPGRGRHGRAPGRARLVREVHAGSSYLSSEDPRVHFGLGAARDGARARRCATPAATSTGCGRPADRIVTGRQRARL